MLGETNLLSGSLRSPRTHLDATPINGYSIVGPWTTETWLNDSVSYAPQQAYIRHGTIRDNILSGQPMWRSRYKEALREASLLSDLALLSDGDLTEVGDHGVTLVSGTPLLKQH
jgi:ABC-type transport system involved in cytochrome bd biosynthesis fused ATPase/permease subunit